MRYPAFACVVAVLLAGAGSAAANVDRAWANYNAIVNGTRQLADLTSIEVRELIELDRQLRREQADKRTPRQKCIDEEIDSLGQEPSHLARRTIDLKCSQR